MSSNTFIAEMAVGSWNGTPLFPHASCAVDVIEKKMSGQAADFEQGNETGLVSRLYLDHPYWSLINYRPSMGVSSEAKFGCCPMEGHHCKGYPIPAVVGILVGLVNLSNLSTNWVHPVGSPNNVQGPKPPAASRPRLSLLCSVHHGSTRAPVLIYTNEEVQGPHIGPQDSPAISMLSGKRKASASKSKQPSAKQLRAATAETSTSYIRYSRASCSINCRRCRY
ncbi:hypothetical protein FA95DRAFT_1578217 [Auriscalpium vulgare]|uniref:Uncharacterized protein n=1 Tax=Auriscalpium vulgare TaxID=40419 RepID=A0ACB8R3T9_9AGAM|nr:hypothetical protein FA95DRAFT_1578217 [Auriscalpium vulgare]